MRRARLPGFLACLLMGALMAGASVLSAPEPARAQQPQPAAETQGAAASGPQRAAATGAESAATASPGTDALVRVLSVNDVISPASADFISRGLREAGEQGAALAVLQLDTPGGLDTSMRSIVRAILASHVPVATFVGPGGARAASAGVFILYASHIAAMTPASNLGAASPVSIGFSRPGGGEGSPDVARPGKQAQGSAAGKDAGSGNEPGAAKGGKDAPGVSSNADTMTRKVTNDAAAYLRSLAQLRNRNAEFAEQAVYEATSLSSREALDKRVIDIIANDVPDLLAKLDGRTVSLGSGREVRLALKNAVVEVVEPDWRTRLLAIIANPQIAVVLMMVGIYGLFFELMNPGAVLPGVAGLVSLLLAMYAFQLLPVNWAGLGLLLAGIAMMVAEVFLPSFGALGVGGIVAFVVGGLMLTDTGIPGYDLSLPFLAGMAVAAAGLIVLTGILAARAARSAVVSGKEGMLGLEGRVTAVTGDLVYADVGGESWRVRAKLPLKAGDRIRVRRVDGLTLQVDRLDSGPP